MENRQSYIINPRSNDPFITQVEIITIVRNLHNPAYNQDALCVCGHPYHRHFDGYENMANVGCKYCIDCREFRPAIT